MTNEIEEELDDAPAEIDGDFIDDDDVPVEEDLDLEDPLSGLDDLADDADDDDDDDDISAPRARKVVDDDDDDEDDDEEVEADLEAILRDRMASPDDDDDDDDDDEAQNPLGVESVVSQRMVEFVCDSCFMLVNRSQFGTSKDPRCPMGDPDCPSIGKIFG